MNVLLVCFYLWKKIRVIVVVIIKIIIINYRVLFLLFLVLVLCLDFVVWIVDMRFFLGVLGIFNEFEFVFELLCLFLLF